MRTASLLLTPTGELRVTPALARADLVLWFAAPGVLARVDPHAVLAERFPGAAIVGCTTGGEVAGAEVLDDALVGLAIAFDASRVTTASVGVDAPKASFEAGRALGRALDPAGLRAVFVLADGVRTNGTALVRGLTEVLPEGVLVTGGLAGDGARFGRTLVGCRGPAAEGTIAAVAFHGERLRFGWGSVGGWDRFGPERVVTRATDNVLHELDGEPALALYKRYLGDEAKNLPGAALLFPLTVRPPGEERCALVRTIVGIDEAAQSLVFAGDVPRGSVAQLMRGYLDALVEGAARAAELAAPVRDAGGDVAAIAVSCIGRKLLMGQRTADEIEAVAEALGPRATLSGFYSYGELAPHEATLRTELHNQTMTLTTIAEAGCTSS
jgi:hypothetical protein